MSCGILLINWQLELKTATEIPDCQSTKIDCTSSIIFRLQMHNINCILINCRPKFPDLSHTSSPNCDLYQCSICTYTYCPLRCKYVDHQAHFILHVKFYLSLDMILSKFGYSVCFPLDWQNICGQVQE